jgi:hypothetical protein
MLIVAPMGFVHGDTVSMREAYITDIITLLPFTLNIHIK